MPAPATERSAHARVAALARVAREPSGAAMTATARRAFQESFYAATDAGLPEAERRRMAEAARRAYYQRLSLRAARARRRLREAALDVAAAEADLADGPL